MSSQPPAVQVRDLSKRYGNREAVQDLSFEVQQGQIFALLGPNGAGKTSTVEMLEGFRRWDAGDVRVLGLNPLSQARELKSRIGVMLQEGGLYPAITPREALTLFARLYPRARDTGELLDLLGLEHVAGTRWRRLSGGEKQRVKLALALLPNPELVFLDEPTAGMDPAARRTTWEIVRGLRASGTTVILTTHYLEEAEQLADLVGIMVDGRFAALDRPDVLVSGSGDRVTARLARPAPPGLLEGLPCARGVRSDGRMVTFDTGDAPELLVQIAHALRDADVPLVDLRVGSGSLEDVFLELSAETDR